MISFMKNLRLTGPLMTLLVCLFTFCACGSDDEKDSTNGGGGNNQSGQVLPNGLDQRLIGTWTCIVSEGWEYNAGGVVLVHWKDLSAISTERWEFDDQGNEVSHNTYNEPDKPEWEMVTFNADGSFYDIDEDGQKPKGSWQSSNGVLTLTVSGKNHVKSYSFKGNTLVIVSEEYEEEDGKRYLASKTVDNFERGTFNTADNTINPNGGGYQPNINDDEPDVDPSPDAQFNVLGVWRSYKIIITETQEIYNVQNKNDENYIEFEFSDGGNARYSFWDEEFVNIPLKYTVSDKNVRVYSNSSQANLNLSYDVTEDALVLSRSMEVQNVSYTVNVYFHK
jgi:hypothetical protein